MKKMNMKAMLYSILLLALFFLSSCMKMHIDIVWNENNSANVSMTIGVATSMLEMMETTEEEIQKQLRDGMAEEDGYSFENFSDAEYTGIIATLFIDDITAHSSNTLEGLKFICSDNGEKKIYSIEGNMESSDISGDNSELEGVEIDMKISLVMPGQILSNNALEQDGNKLTWSLTDAQTSIQATSESSPSGGGVELWVWILIGSILFVGLVAVVLCIVMKKKKKDGIEDFSPQNG